MTERKKENYCPRVVSLRLDQIEKLSKEKPNGSALVGKLLDEYWNRIPNNFLCPYCNKLIKISKNGLFVEKTKDVKE